MSAVVNAIETEIAEIERDLAQNPDPRLGRLAHLRAVKDMYLRGAATGDRSQDDPADFSPPPFIEESMRFRLLPHPTGRRPSPDRVKATGAAYEYLLDKTGPVRTAAIYDHLTNLGIPVSGTVPVNNLSAMLSNDDRFRSNGRSGWTLRQKEAA